MESRAGGHVKVRIGVVDTVEPPEQGQGMKHDMLKIDGSIEHQDGQHSFHGDTQVELIQNPELVEAGVFCNTDKGGREQNAQDQGVQHDDADVGRPPLEPGVQSLPSGP